MFPGTGCYPALCTEWSYVLHVLLQLRRLKKKVEEEENGKEERRKQTSRSGHVSVNRCTERASHASLRAWVEQTGTLQAYTVYLGHLTSTLVRFF